MNMNDLRRHYGTQKKAAEALKTSEQVVSAWNKNGIPRGWQYEIQVITGGALRANPPELVQSDHKRAG